jgi:hypothetical protein
MDLSRALDEIALDGRNGCTITRLKEFLHISADEFQFTVRLLKSHPQLGFDQISETFVATEQLQKLALGIPADGSVSLNPTQLLLLEQIARVREKGLLQSGISEVMKIDSAHYHVKVLSTYNLMFAFFWLYFFQ